MRARIPAGAVLLCGLLLAWPAAWNGYPLVFADSGTYLGQAILIYLGWDRPVHYSLFLHALHWRQTLWPIPLAQGLITAHLLALCLRVLDRPGAGPLLCCGAAMAVLTGLPWFAAQIMPDVFSGLLVLLVWLLAFGWAGLSRLERAWVLLLTAGAVAIHLSHLPLALGLAGVAGAIAWLRGLPVLPVLGRVAAPTGLAVLALVGANAIGHKRFAVAPFSSVFLAARLLEDGPALRTLDARCATEQWDICRLRPLLPMPANDFLWPPEGPLRGKLGGGKVWAGEASAIVRETLRREPLGVATALLRNSLLQLGMLGTGDGLQPWPGDPGPQPLIASHFPHELPAYEASRQSAGQLVVEARLLSRLHVPLAWAGLLALPVVALLRRRHLPAMALCAMVLAAAAGNALITGGLSGPNERYQGRIAWLLVFAPAAAIAAAPMAREQLVGQAV